MKSRYTTLVLFLALGACSPDQVTLCGSAIVDPHSAPLAVGDSTTLTASFDQTHGCTPPAPAGQLRWSTADAGTARVDSITGVVIGVAPGTVDIAVRLQGTQTTLGSGRVVVFAPLFDRIVTIRRRITCSTPSCSVWSNNGPIGIWTLAANGSDLRVLRDSMRYPDHPRVSPDGRAVLFDEWDTLYVVDGAGQKVRPISTGLPFNHLASWSPDGRWVLFADLEPGSDKRQLYVVRPDGTGLRRLTNDPFGVGEAAWSPDGSTIAFVRDSMANSRQAGAAMLMDTSGANIRVVSGGISPFYGRLPEWSPDGTALVFLARPFVTRLDIATGQYDTLAAWDMNRPASWSPDGARILVSGDDIGYVDPAGRYPNGPVTVLRAFGSDSMLSWSAFYTPKHPLP